MSTEPSVVALIILDLATMLSSSLNSSITARLLCSTMHEATTII